MIVSSAPTVALAIHGGTSVLVNAGMPPEEERTILDSLTLALDAGHAVLADGGPALDAVEAAVVELEEAPWFNAGRGAAFDAAGRHRLDASIMDGRSQRAGAVAGVETVRNPVRLARAVMEDSPYVLLAGEGAERFADTRPRIERVPNAWFDTPARRAQWWQAQADETAGQTRGQNPDDRHSGTVGAVALDAYGHLAAATSTGGITHKRWGRVGDAALIGAGTWADAQCAVSCTGRGELFIRHAVAHDIAMRMAYRGDDVETAAQAVILGRVPRAGGDGGAIIVDRHGRIAMPFSTDGMYRGWWTADHRKGVAIFRA